MLYRFVVVYEILKYSLVVPYSKSSEIFALCGIFSSAIILLEQVKSMNSYLVIKNACTYSTGCYVRWFEYLSIPGSAYRRLHQDFCLPSAKMFTKLYQQLSSENLSFID